MGLGLQMLLGMPILGGSELENFLVIQLLSTVICFSYLANSFGRTLFLCLCLVFPHDCVIDNADNLSNYDCPTI